MFDVLVKAKPVPRKQNPPRNAWGNFKTHFEEQKWDPNDREYARFVETYKIQPTVVYTLTEAILALPLACGKDFGSRFSIGDRILLAICDLRDYSWIQNRNVFGGNKSSINAAMNKGLELIGLFDYVLLGNFPTAKTAQTMAKRLAQKGAPTPNVLTIADGVELPIKSSNGRYYCRKKNNPGSSSIRVCAKL